MAKEPVISDKTKKENAFHLSGEFLTQTMLVGSAGLWLGFSLVDDIIHFLSSPLVKQEDAVFFVFAIAITFIGAVLPVWLTLYFYVRWKKTSYRKRNLQPPYQRTMRQLARYGVIALPAIALLGCFITVELIIPFSVVPLSTPVCAVLLALIIFGQTKRMNLRYKSLAVVVFVAFVLFISFVDWNFEEVIRTGSLPDRIRDECCRG
jgi:hypothetical protein